MSEMSDEEFNEILGAALSGLPITLVLTRLQLAIRALWDELSTHGRDSRRLLIEYLERPNNG